MDPLSVARKVAEELVGDGAKAVALVGSHARGDAGSESDLDILAVGQESYLPRLQVREGMLSSVSMQPLSVHRESFELPEMVCEAVPGWRNALVLHDPKELAAVLIREAREWTWDSMEQSCDAWVAEEVTARAETVHKLVAALSKKRLPTASVKRSVLAARLAGVMAVHRRILYGSENRLWDLVSDTMGEEWRRAQSTALGLDDERFEATCQAALRLYGLAVDAADHLFDGRQREVVRRARVLYRCLG